MIAVSAMISSCQAHDGGSFAADGQRAPEHANVDHVNGIVPAVAGRTATLGERLGAASSRAQSRSRKWAWSQMWSHSPPSGTVHRRSPGARPRMSRTFPDPGGHWSALLESVLGATPREFESPILRHADQARRRRSWHTRLVTLRSWSQFWPTWAVGAALADWELAARPAQCLKECHGR
jgi:hypothetical protein